MQLHQNEGTIDRAVRVILGAVLVGLAVASVPAAPWLWVSATIGAILAATGIAGFCPLYAVLRLSTRKVSVRDR